MIDPVLLSLLDKGGLVAIAGVALWLLQRTHMRHDADRKTTIAALESLVQSNLEQAKEVTATLVRVVDRVDELIRKDRRAA